MRVKIRAKIKEPEKIEISTQFIKLDSFLKLSAIAETGGMAKGLIEDGEAAVNGEICRQRGRKLRPGDEVEVLGHRLVVAAVERCT